MTEPACYHEVHFDDRTLLKGFKFTQIAQIEVTYNQECIKGVQATYKVDLAQSIVSMQYASTEDGYSKSTLFLAKDEHINKVTTWDGNKLEALVLSTNKG